MKQKILEIINKNGIRDAGFCAFDLVKERLLPCRALRRLPENAKTVILLLFPYKVRDAHPENICRYASVPDYHDITQKYLSNITDDLKKEFPDYKFESFADNSPIPEVSAAAAAGLGVYGENGLLINKTYGSWCFICEIVTDLEIPAENHFKRCPVCGNCKKACPRGDLEGKCLSAVTQQKKELNFAEKAALKKYNTVWGCDICAEVCPLNKNAANTYIPEFISGYRDRYEYGEDISGRAYEWRGEKVIKRNYEIIYGEMTEDHRD